MLNSGKPNNNFRTKQYPAGVPGMECDVLTCANKIINNMTKMIGILMDNKILVTVENPRGSVLWYYPDLVALVEAQYGLGFSHGDAE